MIVVCSSRNHNVHYFEVSIQVLSLLNHLFPSTLSAMVFLESLSFADLLGNTYTYIMYLSIVILLTFLLGSNLTAILKKTQRSLIFKRIQLFRNIVKTYYFLPYKVTFLLKHIHHSKTCIPIENLKLDVNTRVGV